MNRHLCILALLVLASGAAQAQKVHRWVDEDGNVHFGDKVPAQYAGQIGKEAEPSEPKPEDVSMERFTEEERLRWEEEARQADRDRVLLRTYLTVEEIEDVRDRRIEQLNARTYVTERYLERLQVQLEDQQRAAAQVAADDDPRSAEDNAALARELEHDILNTEASIADYEARLAASRAEQDRIRTKFAADIKRFRELKGLPAQTSASADQ